MANSLFGINGDLTISKDEYEEVFRAVYSVDVECQCEDTTYVLEADRNEFLAARYAIEFPSDIADADWAAWDAKQVVN